MIPGRRRHGQRLPRTATAPRKTADAADERSCMRDSRGAGRHSQLRPSAAAMLARSWFVLLPRRWGRTGGAVILETLQKATGLDSGYSSEDCCGGRAGGSTGRDRRAANASVGQEGGGTSASSGQGSRGERR